MDQDEQTSFFVDFDEAEVPSAFLTLLERINNLKLVVNSFKGWDEEVSEVTSSTYKSLSKIKQNFAMIRSLPQQIADNVQCLQNEEYFAKYLRQKSEYIVNNIPDRFNCGTGTTQITIIDKNVSVNSKEVSTKEHSSEDALSRNKTSNIPKVLFLTLDEFEKVPKYLKGRVTYDKINGFIEVFNKVIASKYEVFKKKKSTLKKKDAQLWNEYNKQELKETKGMYFCVAEDFKNLSGCVLDKIGLNMLTILRHCGRIRELRTGGILRYVLMI